jgi:hypothetical protein
MTNRKNPYKVGESWKTGSSDKLDRMKAFLDWTLADPAEREPATKTEFAASVGVSLQTLHNYEKEPWFQRQVDRQSRGLFKATRMPDVISTLFRIATDEGHKNAVAAARTLLEWQSRIVESEDTDFSGLTTEQLEEMLNVVSD